MSKYTMQTTVSSQPPKQICTHFRLFCSPPPRESRVSGYCWRSQLQAALQSWHEQALWLCSSLSEPVSDTEPWPFLCSSVRFHLSCMHGRGEACVCSVKRDAGAWSMTWLLRVSGTWEAPKPCWEIVLRIWNVHFTRNSLLNEGSEWQFC